MKTNKHQHPIRLVTTISVYLGLVLVGASPQVIAQANLSGDAQSRIFEFTTKTGNVFKKLKLRQETEQNEVVSFPFAYPAAYVPVALLRFPCALPTTFSQGPAEHTNDQVFVVSMLARASI